MKELARVTLGNGVNSETFKPTGGGTYTFFAYNTFASATALLQVSYDGGTTWITMRDTNNADVSLTANGMFSDIQFVASGAVARVNIAGGGGTTSVVVGVLRNTGV